MLSHGMNNVDAKKEIELTSLNVDSLIGSKLPKIESTCLTTIIGLEIYLEHRQLQ